MSLEVIMVLPMHRLFLDAVRLRHLHIREPEMEARTVVLAEDVHVQTEGVAMTKNQIVMCARTAVITLA